MRIRRQITKGRLIRMGRSWVTWGGTVLGSNIIQYDFSNAIIADNSCIDELHAGPPYKQGGPLTLYHVAYPTLDLKGVGSWVYPKNWQQPYVIAWHYDGGFLPLNMTSYVDGYLADMYSIGDASQYGASAWNKFKPKQSTADLNVFLGELREIPKMLKTTSEGFHYLWRSMGGNRTKFSPRAVGDHWLNTQFGWRPFLNDLRKFLKTYRNLDSLIKQRRRDNGKEIKRGGSVIVPINTYDVFKEDNVPNCTPIPDGPLMRFVNGIFGHTVWSYTMAKTVWFEGKFKYYMPELDGSPDVMSIQNILTQFGLSVSPSLVWELTPWSWLIDWFSNAGDVISNIESAITENLVASYAYTMCKARRAVVNSTTLQMIDGDIHMEWIGSVETKMRAEANPFGFGLNYESLSPYQLSILTALGMSRHG